MNFWRLHRRLMAFFALFALLYPPLLHAAGLGIASVRTSPQGWQAQSAASLPADVQAMEAATLNRLFDRDTRTEYTAFDEQSLDIALDGERDVTAIRVFGAAPYVLSVQRQQRGGWKDIQGLKSLDLSQLPETWHSFETNNPVKVETLRVHLEPASSDAAGLKELEIWSHGEHIPVETGSQLLTQLEQDAMQDQGLVAQAQPQEGMIGSISEQNPDDPTDNTFSMQLAVPPTQVKYAYLVYETSGLAHWMNAVRVINDQPAMGGVVVESNDAWTQQIERLDPTWLKEGLNRVRFTVPQDRNQMYQVRNVRLMVELDNGANFVGYIGASQTDDQAAIDRLYDGSTNSGMVVYSGTAVGPLDNEGSDASAMPPGLVDNPGQGLHLGWVKGNAPWKQALSSAIPVSAGEPVLEMGFDRGVELEAVGFYLRGKLAGKVQVETWQDGQWLPDGKQHAATAMKNGWAELPVQSAQKVRGVRLVFSGGEGSSGEIRELTVRGSGVDGAWLPPEVVVTYPDAGQYYGRQAYVRGFLQGLANDSGDAQLFIGGRPLNHVNGEFQTLISKDDIGLEGQADDTPWTVTVEAVYPDGERTTTQVPLFVNKGALVDNDADSDTPPVDYVPITPEDGGSNEFEGAGIDVDPGTVPANLNISMMPLRDIDLASLDSWMTNVTGPHNGYRFLPHGKHFNKKIEVRLKYQPSKLPPGFSEDDIKTFYFDDQAGKWKELERKAIDKGKNEVVALTDHFTDMINAVIQVPDSPQNTQFNPTQIKDIKAADPGAKVNLIEPPQANNMGDARLSYPIEVPPGRRGMQPQLAVQYSSGGGNGWMGHGWDIGMQSITIDTRWGVPRYKEDKETETYLLNGEQLTPLAHRGEPESREAEKVFHTRVEGAFQRIVRHGDSPKNYWWEVTDKSGTTYFYGGDDTTSGPVADSTLETDKGNIGKWALHLVRDSNGNEIRYQNTRVKDSGLGNGTIGEPGYQLYLDKIYYTGYQGNKGAYEVGFIRDRQDPQSPRRRDVSVDARLGFKQVTADLLKQIDVSYNGQKVRSYTFGYREGAYAKTLLETVKQLDEKGKEFNAHSFDYFDEIRDEALVYKPLEDLQDWKNFNDHIDGGLRISRSDFKDDASATSGIGSESKGKHVAVTVGVYDGNSACKSFTVGGGRNSSKSKSEGLLGLADINADGLPDKIFKTSKGIEYRAGTLAGFSSEKELAANLGSFQANDSRTRSGDVQATIGCALSGTAAISKSTTITKSNTYFTDVNGDGLVDVASNGRVYFNHRSDDGEHYFSTNSADTPNAIGSSAAITSDLIQNDAAEIERLLEENPLHDVVRVWQAPFDGDIQVKAPVSLEEDNSPERSFYEHADGVRVAIQHKGDELWATEIAADDYNPKNPVGVDRVAVNKGDRIYFRVQSIRDGNFDVVNWNPDIRYLDQTPTVDANDQDIYSYKAEDDFLVAAAPGQTITVPMDGTVKITGEFRKPETSDAVTVRIKHNSEVIWSQDLAADDEIIVPHDLSLDIAKDDNLAFQVVSDTTIRWNDLGWMPRVFYTEFADPEVVATNENGEPTVELLVMPSMRLFSRHITREHSPWSVPQVIAVADAEGNDTGERVTLDIQHPLSVHVEPSTTFEESGGALYFTVKRDNQLVAKQRLVVIEGQVFDPADLPPEGQEIIVEELPKPSVVFQANPGNTYWFEYHTTNTALATKATEVSQIVTLVNAGDGAWEKSVAQEGKSGLRTQSHDIRFGHMYRNWGQFAWNGNGDRAEQPIVESKLNLDSKNNPPSVSGFENVETEEGLENEFSENGYDPAKDRFILMFPHASIQGWQGYDDLTWIKASTVSSSRFGIDEIQSPDPVPGASARAIVKLTRNDATSYSLGVGGGFVNGGAARTEGKSRTLVDFMDMNGDRYPDVVGQDRIQFTTPYGGLSSEVRALDWLNLATTQQLSNTDAKSRNLGGSLPLSKSEAINTLGDGAIIYSNNPPSVGVSGSLGESNDAEEFGWSDVNGDGLPDRIHKNGNVQLNLGYRFTDPEPWGVTTKRGLSESEGASLGFSVGTVSIAGGLSLNRSDTQSLRQLYDVNGDGLPDVVDATGSQLKVALNSGAGFLDFVEWEDAGAVNQAATVTEAANGAFTACIPIIPIAPVAKVCFNAGANGSKGISREERSLRDINGDGYPDFLVSNDDHKLEVRLNTHGRTNLLKSVKRPLGASFDIDYERKGNTYEMPQSKWVMNKVTVLDGYEGDGVDTQMTTVDYADGYYDRRERDFLGFNTVTINEHDTSQSGAPVYRSVTQTWLNDSVYERGLLTHTMMVDADGNPYTETEKGYRFVNVDSGQEVPRTALPGQLNTRLFPQVSEEISRFYEGEDQAGKQTRKAYLEYDGVGNVTHFIDYADSGAADDVEARITYFYDEAAWIMGAAKSIKVYGNSELLRHRESTIEAGTGNVSDIRQHYEDGVARYDFTYDDYGNLDTVTGPANDRGQRYAMTYGYDTQVSTHVTRVEDSFGYVSTAKPDYRWGQPKQTTSINNQTIRYTFDSVGRTRTITGPYEQAIGQPTISFEYYPAVEEGDPLNWALTRHYDPEHPADRIETALFTDGLKRVLQTKKDGTVGDGNGEPEDVMVVSGRVIFDHVGRSVKQYYPNTEALGRAGMFNPAFDLVAPTVTDYDVLDRPLKVTIPDSTSTAFDYGFGTDRDGKTQFRTRITDANGVSKDSFRDVRQLITAVKEYNNGGNEVLWTSYQYDPLKQITDVLDAQQNLTTAKYDRLGRRTVLDNPDTGKVEMVYDPAGNLSHKITPNLRSKGQAINYRYDYNRLAAIDYPEFTGNNITYEYGEPGEPHNGANRIIKVTDQAGWETRQYGPLGELIQSTRNIKWSAGPAESYTTEYQYDTWNRLQQLIYPDGEVLTYDYNKGGLMSAVQGKKGKYDYPYVQALHYDKFEQRTWLHYGNNTENRYSYNRNNRRMSHLTAGKGDGNKFMDLEYGYDDVGNITTLSNRAPVNSPSQMGGVTHFSYDYDDLYRLTGSTGTFDTQPDKQHAYTLDMRYDTVHNITSKVQHHTLKNRSGKAVTQKKTSYDWSGAQGYKYDGPQPHAPTHIGERAFSYDANGNQLGWTHDKNGTRRTITWDEENRIQNIKDNGHTFTYTYDASGQRITKRGPQGETGYINQWMTLRNGEVGTKHVFAGTTRVVSKMVKQDKPNTKRNSANNGNGNGNGKARIVYEKDQYYFHPDHLGSTSYITHTNGQVYQHLEYFPFGETWVEEHSNKQRTPYLFTGKELDEGTQLYYFGARYYDPRTSVWQSPDPVLDRYLSSSLGQGGIYEPRNLGMYSYAHMNPVIMMDPDGNSVLSVADWYDFGSDVGALLVDEIVWVAATVSGDDAVAAMATEGMRQKRFDAAASTAGIVSPIPGAGRAIKASKKLDDAGDMLRRANKNTPCPLSFAPGTLVSTPTGMVAIEELKVGDLVMSKNDITGEVLAKPVVATISTQHEDDVRLITVKTLTGEEQAIIASDEHPFYVPEAGWVEAGQLAVGDHVFTLPGQSLTVVGTERLSDSLLMYNLTVDEFHTYSVTEEEVWVHNCKGKAPNGRRTKHIDNRHVDRKKYPEKSKFKNPNQIEKINDRTVKKPDRVVDQGSRTRYEKDFGRDIGTNGERTNTTVIDKRTGKRVTQFPKQ